MYFNISCVDILWFSFLGESGFCIVIIFMYWNSLSVSYLSTEVFAENAVMLTFEKIYGRLITHIRSITHILYNSHNVFCFASLYLCLPPSMYSVCILNTSRIHITLVKSLNICVTVWKTASLPAILISHLLYGVLRKFWMSLSSGQGRGFWGSADRNARNLIWVFQPCLWNTRAVWYRKQYDY